MGGFEEAEEARNGVVGADVLDENRGAGESREEQPLPEALASFQPLIDGLVTLLLLLRLFVVELSNWGCKSATRSHAAESLELLIGDRPPIMAAAAAATGKRSVCLCVEDKWGTEWYTLDLSDAGDHEVTVCPCSRRLRHVTQGSPCLLPRAFVPREYEGGRFPGWAVLGGDQLYVVGGEMKIPSSFPPASQPLQTVWSLDLSTGKAWVRRPPMLAPRSRPSVVTVGGELYVLGGVADYPWGEVYDPGSNTWEALPDPPVVPAPGFFSAGDDDNGCVIILSVETGVVMEYYVGAKRWKMCELPANYYLPPEPSHGSAIAVGRVVYWHSIDTSHLYGLDLDTHDLYSGMLVSHNSPYVLVRGMRTRTPYATSGEFGT
ncbi:hypothetical protein Tsubulata_012350 [Turnera subulata]|uniref:Uncharacterized protein n=1 Tax=Turnera subulata TaxID=218843 RepID=A0A9Q0IZN4_9ROSI|nr:hypothetical protein Tsubulata_012350 [Turnera subulata]